MVNTIRTEKMTPIAAAGAEWQDACLRAFAAAKNPIIISDYDGTLREFVLRPEDAVPSRELLNIFKALASKCAACVCSGRDGATLQRWFGQIPISLVAEHGARIRAATPGAKFVDVVQPAQLGWMATAKAIMDRLTTNTPGSHVEVKATSLSWHYRGVSDQKLAAARADDLTRALAKQLPANAEARPGKLVVEARPRGVDKGGAVDKLAKGHDFVLVLGDDHTDEDMFAYKGGNVWSVKVGDGETKAKHRLGSPAAVRAFLGRLANAR
jgi:trehalose 6-phosphate synthase/phosphatase